MKNLIKGRVSTMILLYLVILLTTKASSQTASAPLSMAINGTTTLSGPAVTGGTVVRSGVYNIHTFTSSSTMNVPSGYNVMSEVLVVAGGGGGGYRHAGGGGAGGLIHVAGHLLSNSTPVLVGNGGAGSNSATILSGANGDQSSFDGITATGGGGGSTNGNRGKDGGSGGGGSNGSSGGSGTSGQGMKGGDQNHGNGCCYAFGAGGGGYSAAGANTGEQGSAGGAGVAFDISGTSAFYAGGGGGGTGYYRAAGIVYPGGTGGGGTGGTQTHLNGADGMKNTGGGGGGGGSPRYELSGKGGAGGSGIVIIKYLFSAGVWVSSNTNIATVNETSGVVTAMATGTVNMIYTSQSGTFTNTYTQVINVLPAMLPRMTVPAAPVPPMVAGVVPVPSTVPYTNGLQGKSLISGISNQSTFSAMSETSGSIVETWTATDMFGRTLEPVSRTIPVTPKPVSVQNSDLLTGHTASPALGASNPFSLDKLGIVKKDVLVYPNPTRGQVHIDLGANSSSNYSIQVYDMMGKIVYASSVYTPMIDLSSSAAGIYTLRVTLNSKLITTKMMIEK